MLGDAGSGLQIEWGNIERDRIENERDRERNRGTERGTDRESNRETEKVTERQRK